MLGSDGEGPDCPCSRASLANWNVWVHRVQEDPPIHSPLAGRAAFECMLHLLLNFVSGPLSVVLPLQHLSLNDRSGMYEVMACCYQVGVLLQGEA